MGHRPGKVDAKWRHRRQPGFPPSSACVLVCFSRIKGQVVRLFSEALAMIACNVGAVEQAKAGPGAAIDIPRVVAPGWDRGCPGK